MIGNTFLSQHLHQLTHCTTFWILLHDCTLFFRPRAPKRKAPSANSGDAGHRALYAVFWGYIYIAGVLPVSPESPCSPRAVATPLWEQRLVTTWLPSKWRRLRVRVDRLESGSAVAGSPPAGATTISAPCGIFHYIDDRLHKTRSSPRGSTLFPLRCPPHSLFSLLGGVFFFLLSLLYSPDQDKPSCGCVWGFTFFLLLLLGKAIVGAHHRGSQKVLSLFHRRLVSACPRYILICG